MKVALVLMIVSIFERIRGRFHPQNLTTPWFLAHLEKIKSLSLSKNVTTS
jgi:hypothetical protein